MVAGTCRVFPRPVHFQLLSRASDDDAFAICAHNSGHVDVTSPRAVHNVNYLWFPFSGDLESGRTCENTPVLLVEKRLTCCKWLLGLLYWKIVNSQITNPCWLRHPFTHGTKLTDSGTKFIDSGTKLVPNLFDWRMPGPPVLGHRYRGGAKTPVSSLFRTCRVSTTAQVTTQQSSTCWLTVAVKAQPLARLRPAPILQWNPRM